MLTERRQLTLVKKYAARPYSVLFASCTASSSLPNLNSGMAGPKVSSLKIFMSVVAPEITVGA